MGARTARANVAFAGLIAAVLVVVGCLSAWATVEGHTYVGTDANAGKSTLFAAVVSAVILVLATALRRRWLSIVAAIPAALAAAISSYRFADISNFVKGLTGASSCWGIWLTMLSAVLLLALCIAHALLPVDDEPEEPAVTESGSDISP